LASLALLYSVFVVYGSLVPLEYRAMPLDRALAAFRHIPFLDLGMGSRADWVANLLLFVPLAFLWQGVVWPRGLAGRIASSALLWPMLVAASVAIEFTQLYFPPRTVSQNDILAEAIGGALGMAAWWLWGPALWRWVRDWRAARGVSGLAERLLWAYLAVLFGYNLLPLDLTLSPVEVYHSWKEGKVVLIPFQYPVQGLAEWLYAFAVDTAVWVPVSALWVISGRKDGAHAWVWAVLAALALEVAQLFVYSRVADTTDLLTAALGAGLGVLAAARWRPAIASPTPARRNRRLALGLTAFALVALGLAAVFWYPFDFRLDSAFLRQRMALLRQVPFENYYFGTEYRAITELMHKVGFFIPLGVALAYARSGLAASPLRSLFDLAAAAALLATGLAIELGQLALPGKYPDSTDWALESLGGLGGYLAALALAARLGGAPGGPASPRRYAEAHRAYSQATRTRQA
jgi:glycopeptide antibiotics resistance protein